MFGSLFPHLCEVVQELISPIIVGNLALPPKESAEPLKGGPRPCWHPHMSAKTRR
jgi:hypothetical protein